MRIEIWSDVVCPWCYIGKRRFEAALADLDDVGPVEVVWRAFELDPTVPPEGQDHLGVLRAKFGGAERVEAMLAHVGGIAETEGLDYRWDRMTVRPNTRVAHRLVWVAGEHHGAAVQDALVEALFRANFTEGRDVGDPAVLRQVALDAGLPVDDVDGVLDGELGAAEVAAEEAEAASFGITGVPCFVIDRVAALSGAHDPDQLAAVIRQVARGEVTAG